MTTPADNVGQTAQQILQDAAQAAQNAKQAAQQAEQAASQASSSSRRSAISTDMPGLEVPYEIGKDEAWSLNMKHLFDSYHQLALRLANGALDHDARLRGFAELGLAQALQGQRNTQETDNMVGKQAVRHADIAIEATWNSVRKGVGDLLTSINALQASVEAFSKKAG